MAWASDGDPWGQVRRERHGSELLVPGGLGIRVSKVLGSGTAGTWWVRGL